MRQTKKNSFAGPVTTGTVPWINDQDQLGSWYIKGSDKSTLSTMMHYDPSENCRKRRY